MSTRVAGRIALVTGAASGIGRSTALLLAREGARVAVTDINGAGARECAQEAGADAFPIRLDVTLETDWEAAFATVAGRWGQPDIVVVNAGISFAKPVTDMELAEWGKVMAVNLDGVFLGTKHAVRAMRESGSGGSIVIVSSASGIKASPGASAYCASKAALRLFSKSVALECAENGDAIRVNTVHPAGVVTPMWKSMAFWDDLVARHGSEEGAWNALGASGGGKPMKRFAKPEEIAQAILYLASDESLMVTGAELVIDGGFTA